MNGRGRITDFQTRTESRSMYGEDGRIVDRGLEQARVEIVLDYYNGELKPGESVFFHDGSCDRAGIGYLEGERDALRRDLEAARREIAQLRERERVRVENDRRASEAALASMRQTQAQRPLDIASPGTVGAAFMNEAQRRIAEATRQAMVNAINTGQATPVIARAEDLRAAGINPDALPRPTPSQVEAARIAAEQPKPQPEKKPPEPKKIERD